MDYESLCGIWHLLNKNKVQPLVSIVVLNWNGSNIIEHCLDHVFAQTYSPIEVIVVDNGSQDGSYERLLQKYVNQIFFIRNEENLGYSLGMNQGIAASRGQFILLLNFDVFLQEDYLVEAVRTFGYHGNVQVGAIGGKLFYYKDGQKTRQINSVGLYLRARVGLVNSKNTDTVEYVFAPSGSCPLVRRELFADLSFPSGEWFDDSYFAYGEDLDFWFRSHLRGWRVLFLPVAIGWHIHSASVGGMVRVYQKPDHLQFHAFKNRYMNIIKNFPSLLVICLLPAVLICDVAALTFFLFKAPASLKNMIAAQCYVLKNWSAIWFKRQYIQRRRVVSVSYLLSLFKGL